jgi:hypothetical protein
VANLTNTVALSPGYLGAALGQRRGLRAQASRLVTLLPAAGLGGLLGALLLLHTSERLFFSLVPWLLLLGSGLLWAQQPLRRWLLRLHEHQGKTSSEREAILPIVLASIYGGYFGAGLGVIVLAVLALTLDDDIIQLNALKQAIALVTNASAACVFVLSAQVNWGAAGLVAAGASLGGALGGRLAGRANADALRTLVVIAGVAMAIVYFLH